MNTPNIPLKIVEKTIFHVISKPDESPSFANKVITFEKAQ